MVEPYEGTCYLWTRSEIRFLFYMRTVRTQTGTKVTSVGSATEMKSYRSEFIFRAVPCKRMKRNVWRPIRTPTGLSSSVLVSCKSVPPIVLLVRKSTFDLWFSFFSLKIDFKHWLFILRFDFWCMATVGRHSWQVVSEAKTPWALPWKKLKLSWVKLKLLWVNWSCREQIENAVSKLKLPWANWNCRE